MNKFNKKEFEDWKNRSDPNILKGYTEEQLKFMFTHETFLPTHTWMSKCCELFRYKLVG